MTPNVSHQVVTPDLAEPEHLEFDGSSFVKDNTENHSSSSVNVADLFLPMLASEKDKIESRLIPKRRKLIET